MENIEVTAVRTSPLEWVKIWDEAEAAEVPLPLTYRLETFDGQFVDFPVNTLGGLKEFGKSLNVNSAYRVKGTLSTSVKVAITKRNAERTRAANAANQANIDAIVEARLAQRLATINEAAVEAAVEAALLKGRRIRKAVIADDDDDDTNDSRASAASTTPSPSLLGRMFGGR
jgi:hypothetical protein